MSDSDARRSAILDAALGVFLRYGFKKTSMDDLARAADISRQGLYLHFATKEELFKTGVLRLIESIRDQGRKVLASDLPVDEKVLEFFVAIHAQFVGESAENLNELMDAAHQIVGDAAEKLEEDQAAALAKLLRQSGVAAHWKNLAATDLAAQLFATSAGLKHAVKSADDYRKKMRIAVQIVCNGRAR
jgi:AcrR family transcriptional regulator